MACTSGFCEHNSCFIKISGEPGYYCEVASQCRNDPYWQIIVVPALLALAALIIFLLICIKLRKKKPEKYDVKYYAHEEMYIPPLS